MLFIIIVINTHCYCYVLCIPKVSAKKNSVFICHLGCSLGWSGMRYTHMQIEIVEGRKLMNHGKHTQICVKVKKEYSKEKLLIAEHSTHKHN